MPSLRKSLVSFLLVAVAVSAQGDHHGQYHGRFPERPGSPNSSMTRVPVPQPTFVNGSQTGFPEPPRGPPNETHIPGPHPTDVNGNQLEARITELGVPSEPRNETHIPEPHFQPGNDTELHSPRPHPTSVYGSHTGFPEPPHGRPRNETDFPEPPHGPRTETHDHIPEPHPTNLSGTQSRILEVERSRPSESRNGTRVPEPHFEPRNDTQTHIPPPPSGSRGAPPTFPPHTGTSKRPMPSNIDNHFHRTSAWSELNNQNSYRHQDSTTG